jgi:signal transduction histidine kinase
MITSLVDYAETQHAGTLQIDAAPARMDELCGQVIDEARMLHPERNVELHAGGDTSGLWDGDRVIQAVGNRVMNALKHSSGDVSVHVNGRDEDVVVGIESEGAPFPDAIRAKLFTPFQKGDPHERGLGLGLFIVRQIAVAHGASVALVTPPNDRRTHFVVRWPRTPPRRTEA